MVMDFASIWASLLANWVWWLIVVIAGLVGSYLKKKGYQWAPIILNGLLSAVLVGVLIILIKVQNDFVVQQRSVTTTANVQERVRDWLDKWHLTTTSLSSDDSYFTYTITTLNDKHVIISRPKSHDWLLIFGASILDEKDIMEKLPEKEREEFKSRVIVESARLGFDLGIGPKSNAPKGGVLLDKTIPISGLTEDIMISTLQQMERGIAVVQQFGNAALGHRSP